MNEIRHLSVRIEDNLLKKFRYACKYEDRSANGQILNFIRNFVNEFENNHCKIELPDEKVKSSEKTTNYRKNNGPSAKDRPR